MTILFVCLLWHSYLLRYGCYFFLSIPYGMHLMVPTHPYFFWVVCHPSRTFPPKEPEREPHNRFSLLSTARSYPFLPLTHDSPLLYWLGTGWWCLGLAHALVLCTSKTCLLLMRFPWSTGLSVHSTIHP